jgi:outer membrane protein OmpA-like peptidoglycan-associated protein
MTKRRFGLAVAAVTACTAAAALVYAQDVPRSQDHPLAKRYPSSKITRYYTKEFEACDLPTGKAVGYKFEKSQHVEGKITTITYENPKGRSLLEVYRNYDDALKGAGIQPLFACTNAECGDGYGPVDVECSPQWGTPARTRHFTGKLARAEGDVYVSLHVHAPDTPEWVYTILTVVETKPMDTGLVKVDAGALMNDITRTGHASVYGVYFDTGKSDIKAESAAALAEIAKLLGRDATLKLHVVGHTDSTGALAANIDLSRRRAQAVVAALTTTHKIAADRLRADGVGPLAPVAANATEEGRAKNRRVELVAQ